MRALGCLLLGMLALGCDVVTGLRELTIAGDGGGAGSGGSGGSGEACGDGVRGGNEECDDGNAVDEDGCGSDCAISCPPGWSSSEDAHCYGTAEGSFDWEAARDACAAAGAHLATITTDVEQALVGNLLDGSRWCGATDRAEEGTWVWATDELWSWPLHLSPPWTSAEEPNNQDDEHCLEVTDSGLFNDARCDVGFAALCELP
jgi:cysteine-rich repeat protein